MSVAPPRVVIVDDHRMFRTGVRAELGDHVTVVGEAEDIADAVSVIDQWSPACTASITFRRAPAVR